MRRFAVSLVVVMAVIVAGCTAGSTPSTVDPDGSSNTAPSPPASASASATEGLTYVALGDSWPQGNHCGHCRTFAGRYADGLEAELGVPVEFVDLTGDATTDSTALLKSLRENSRIREAVERADIVLIATGPNEMEGTGTQVATGTCGGDDGFDCLRALGETWTSNFDASVAEILALRGGRPTAIRLVNAANPFLSVPSMITELGLPDDFATTGGALLFQLLTDAVCGAAKKHAGRCVDVRPILNGPAMDQATDENSLENMQAIADALVATGLAELDR